MNDILNVKAGDKVIRKSSGTCGRRKIETVEKVTPTGRIKIGSTYYDNTGREIGADTWSRTWISQATEQEILEIEQGEYINAVMHLMQNAKKISYEQAVAIGKILTGGTT